MLNIIDIMVSIEELREELRGQLKEEKEKIVQLNIAYNRASNQEDKTSPSDSILSHEETVKDMEKDMKDLTKLLLA